MAHPKAIYGDDELESGQPERFHLACDAGGALEGVALEWFQQASTFLCQGQAAEAFQLLEKLLPLAFQHWGMWYQRGVALAELGRYEDAIASYQAALRLQPPPLVEAEIWYQQADVWHYGLGDYAAAIAAYDQVIAQQPQHDLAWLHRGNAQLYGLHQPYTAIASYNRALEINPDQDCLWYNRGKALVDLGFYHAAVNNFDRVLSLNPQHLVAREARQAALEHIQMQSPDSPLLVPTDPAAEDWVIEDWQHLVIVPTSRQEPDWPAPPGELGAQGQFDTYIQRQPTLTCPAGVPPTAAPPRPKVAYLVIQDSQGLRRLQLTGDRLTIGRAAECDVRLYSKFASRCHAVLTRSPAPAGSVSSWQYHLRDGDENGQPSTNGLTINGQKRREHDLVNGDLVHLGPKIWLRYFVVDAHSTDSPPTLPSEPSGSDLGVGKD